MSDKPIPEASTPDHAAAPSPDGPPATPDSDGSAPFATLLAASRDSDAAQRNTAGRKAAPWPPASAMPPMPPPLPRAPKRWEYVARPPGVLPAAALAGIVGATVIPIDSPGIGWLIAGVAVTGALCAVDYRARSRGAEKNSPEAAPNAEPSPAADTDPSHHAAPANTATSEAHASADRTAEAASTPAASQSVDTDARDVSSIATPADSAAARITEVAATSPTTVDAVEHSAKAATQSDAADAGSRVVKRPFGTGAIDDSASDGTGIPFGKSATTRATQLNITASQPVSIGNRVWWAAAAIVLLGVGTVRAAGWLFVLCVIAALVAGSLAVLGRRSVRGIAHDMFAVPLASFGAVPWAFSGLRESRSVGTSSVRRYGVSVAATAALLVVFVPLLGGADATFAELLSGLVPTVDAPAAWQWIFLFVVVTVGVLGALYLLAGPPSRAADSVRPGRLWSRSEWMLPVGALTVLFAVFVGAQFVALFGGDDYVQRTAGLTYAEYARSGFWQLSAVSILTLAVILAVLHWSVQETAADRLSLRVLLSAVSVLALVIVGSALGRMWTYQQAYGFTVLRLLVTTCELWVGLIYVLVLIAIARLRWTWVPRAAIGTALATLIALSVLNPEYLVAERNIDRWQTSGRLDADYLSGLSPDILPALDPLPAHLRTRIEDPVLDDLDPDHWWSWNWSRSSAR